MARDGYDMVYIEHITRTVNLRLKVLTSTAKKMAYGATIIPTVNLRLKVLTETAWKLVIGCIGTTMAARAVNGS